MSKRIKDNRWEINPSEDKEWVAHDVSPSGKNVLLFSEAKWEWSAERASWNEFLLVKVQPDGHYTQMVVTTKDMLWISFCNFLPDGNILILGVNGDRERFRETLHSRDRQDFTRNLEEGTLALVCSILDGATLRPISKEVFTPQSEAILRLMMIEKMMDDDYHHGRFGILLGLANYRIDLSYMDPDSMPGYFTAVIRSPWDSRLGRLRIDFNNDLTHFIIPNEGHLESRENWYSRIERQAEIEPPLHHPGRNWNNKPHLVEFTKHPDQLSSGGAIAMLHSAGRRISVSRRVEGGSRELMKIDLDFGQNLRGSPESTFYKRHSNLEPGLGADYISMAFSGDASSLTVLSYLPYHSPGKYEPDPGDYRWHLHSYDVDGRYAEMERTRLRKEGMWAQQIERKARTDALAKAGLPHHIARLISINKIGDKEGIELFRYLRSSGAPGSSSNERDPLEEVDEMAFSGRLPREDAKWLIEKREHVELIEAVLRSDLSVDRARTILVDMGFDNYPEAVARVVGGADPETVAMIFGIEPESITRDGEGQEEPPSEIKTKSEEGGGLFRRRRSRFS